MNIDNIEFKIIEKKSHLIEYFDDIAELFEVSFKKKLDRSLWEWLYIENPNGDPIVALAFDADKLVGHYAIIPSRLSLDSSNLDSYLSLTTMVSYKYTVLNLFKVLAERVYECIIQKKIPAVVFGFPNEKSKKGFRERLDWQVDDDICIVNVEKKYYPELIDYLRFEMESTDGSVSFNDSNFFEWRVKTKQQTWVIQENVWLKKHGLIYDLMYCKQGISVNELNEFSSLNVLINRKKAQKFNFEYTESFNYRFGYRMFNSEQKFNIFVQMIMSDVF